jgi:hypothetical protein
MDKGWARGKRRKIKGVRRKKGRRKKEEHTIIINNQHPTLTPLLILLHSPRNSILTTIHISSDIDISTFIVDGCH